MKPLVLIGIIAFAGFLSFGISATMMMNEHGEMVNCPFIDENTAICPMSVLGHMSEWCGIFSNFLVSNVLVLAVILALALTAAIFQKPFLEFLRFKFKRLFDFEFLIPDRMVLAFSRGLIHPKVYSL